MSQIFYIFCHACYIPFNTSNFRSPNINLYFDVPVNNISCNKDLQLDFDASNYEYKESYFNPKYDYILSFNDETYCSASFNMCGLFDINHKRIDIKNITNGTYNDVLLSDLVEFLVKTNNNQNERTNIYCSFCRNECKDQPIPTKMNLEFEGDEAVDDKPLIDFSGMDLGDDDDIDYNNLFGGKRRKKNAKAKKSKKRRKITKKRKTNTRKYKT